MLWCAFNRSIAVKKGKDVVLGLLSHSDWYSTIPHIKCTNAERLIFEICKNNTLVTDSFQPVFRLSVQSVDTTSVVYVRISAKQATKVILGIYSIVCVFFQSVMLKMWFSNEMNFSFVLFLPSFLFLFSQVLTHLALRISARHFLKTLSDLVRRSTGDGVVC